MAWVPQVEDEGARRQPPEARVSIRETLDGLGIHNPARRKPMMALFLALWLAGWSAGEAFALSELMRGINIAVSLFLLVWLTIWTLAGLGALAVLLWTLFGSERLFVTGGALVHSIGFGPLRRQRVYALDEVGGFHARKAAPDGAFPVTAIGYRARGRERGFGRGMSRDEGEAALAAIRRALPHDTPPPAVAEEA